MVGKMNRRKQKMAAQVGEFLRQYTRKSQKGAEPNDRQYSRKFERKLKRMKPEEFDELLHGQEAEASEPPLQKSLGARRVGPGDEPAERGGVKAPSCE
jgi:hypothetical protein